MLLDPRFLRLQAYLAPADRAGEPRRVDGEAAVALVFRAADELEMLLVRRAVSESDPWSGHMALPGGRRDVRDGSMLDTAIRETLEETGVQIHSRATLGRLPSVSPQTSRVPTVRVAPFVFGVPGDVGAAVASPEIDSVYWVGLSELCHPANRRTVGIPLIGTVREFPAFMVQGQTVWGLTYRIVSQFVDHVLDAAENDARHR